MRTFVWVEAWQQQCCGEDFEVGSTVVWDARVRKGSVDDSVQLLLDHEWARKVEYKEEHHGEHETTISGKVRSIQVVTCSHAPEQQGGLEVLVPVPGSGKLRAVEIADPWESEPSGDRQGQESFKGWIVELGED